MKPQSSLLSFLAAAAIGLAFHTGAQAADYPTKPVHVVVPVGSGGGVDTVTRLIARQLQNTLGQPFVVDNKPGAGGNIGIDSVAKSRPDGYTLLVSPNAFAINHTLMAGRLPFDITKDFVPVAPIGKAPAVVGGRANLPFNDLKGLVAYAKANPGKLTYAGCETGSLLHLSGEILKQQAGISLVQVPYKGCADTVPNVLGGQVDLLFITLSNVAGYARDGRLKVYAVASKERSPFAPELPTGAEQGYPDFKVEVWYSMLAPTGTPKDIVAKLNKAINDALQQKEVRDAMATNYIEPTGGTPEQLGQMIRSDIERYGDVIRKANIRIE